jgi:putative hemolysin
MVWLELALILGCIFLHGFLACAETALISVRRSRIKELADGGDARARAAQALHADPDRFLATIQIGVTVASTLAAGLAGHLAVRIVGPALGSALPARLPFLATPLAILLVVGMVAYLTLVLGELVPKSLALRHTETIALGSSRSVNRLARASEVLVGALSRTTSALLGLFGVRGIGRPAFVTEEEVRHIVTEGTARGVFDQTEGELIHGVFEFTDTSAKEVMVPRPKMHAIPVDLPGPEVLRLVAGAGHSRYPVYRKSLDDIVGVLHQKDVVRALADGRPLDLAEAVHPTLFVPETKPVSELLKEMQRRRIGMAMVVDEYGGIEGLVTIEDLIEEIVGEIRDEDEAESRPIERLRDGSLLVDASASIRDLDGQHGLAFPESAAYETLAGFLLEQLQRIPRGGENINYRDRKFTVVEMDGRRIARVKVEPAGRGSPPAGPRSP